MIETRCLKNLVIFIQTILSFVVSRKIRKNKMKVDIHNLNIALARELSLHAFFFKNKLIKISSKNGDSVRNRTP